MIRKQKYWRIKLHPQVKGQPLVPSERVRQLPEGSLQIAGVAREDAGEYSCHVDNQFGTDTVTHTLSVLGAYLYGSTNY